MATRYRWALPPALASVIVLAACGDDGGAPPPDGPDTGATIELDGTNALAFEPATLAADAGLITIELSSEATIGHTFVIEGHEGDDIVAPSAETAIGTVDLEPGTYVFYCSVPGHRAAGMEGTLTVE